MAFIAPAKLIIAPAQLITAPAQLITAPAQPPATGAAVYTALFFSSELQTNIHYFSSLKADEREFIEKSLEKEHDKNVLSRP